MVFLKRHSIVAVCAIGALLGCGASGTESGTGGIAVTAGTCQIGVTTTAGANQSITIDDFTFVRTGP